MDNDSIHLFGRLNIVFVILLIMNTAFHRHIDYHML